MNTHDKYELPPLPYIQRCDYVGGSYPIGNREDGELVDYEDHVFVMQAYARAAIEADRKRRGEPVAWMTEDGRVCSTETRNTAMPNVSRVLFNIPLYRAPQPADPSGAQNGIQATQPAEPVKADLIVTKGGIPFKDQNEGIRQFKEACMAAADRKAQIAAEKAAEPVKVPSDADLFAIHDEYFPTMVLGHENYLSFARALLARYGAQPAASAEPVAVVGSVYQLLWAGNGDFPALIKRHELKPGSKLYTAPVAAQPQLSGNPGELDTAIKTAEAFNADIPVTEQEEEEWKRIEYRK